MKKTRQERYYAEARRIANGKWWIEQYLISNYRNKKAPRRAKLNG